MEPRLVVDAVVRPEYIIRYEQWSTTTFVHVDVLAWSHCIAKRFRCDIDAAHRLLGRPVYALQRPEAPNQLKFLKRHGFSPAGRTTDAQGREVDFYMRPLWEAFSAGAQPPPTPVPLPALGRPSSRI